MKSIVEYTKVIISIAFPLFIVMNAIGSVPLFLSLMKGITKKRQTQIIIRELLIALFVIIIFNFIGEVVLAFLGITQHTVQIAGGVVLFLLSIKLLFPPPEIKNTEAEELRKITEPFIVPLAVPLIAGPAVLAMVMLYAHQEPSDIVMVGAIFLAWGASLAILILSSLLSTYLGDKGIVAIERLMGFVMVLISLQMFLSGLKQFLKP